MKKFSARNNNHEAVVCSIRQHNHYDSLANTVKTEGNIFMLAQGFRLNGRYEIEHIIGQGGMSTVYLARDHNLGTSWAIKETFDIYPDKDRSELIEQFKKEAQMLAGLSYPGLPKVIDYFSENGKHYLVEEFIDGKPAEIIMKESRFDERSILKWAVEICNILEFLHQNGIIYRDLKPSNIMIGRDNRVYLVDFGIARFFQGGKDRDTVIIGTPGFASPEHYGRSQTDARSDIFSLGATLHYMTTGINPADKPFQFELPYNINHSVSFRISAIIMKCLDINPAARYQSVSEVKYEIDQLLKDGIEKTEKTFSQIQKPSGRITFKNRTDFIGKTTQALSYSAIFPISMTISGMLMLFATIFGAIPAVLIGIISFPIMTIEFYKRLEAAFMAQDAFVRIEPDIISFKSRSSGIECKWPGIIEVRVIKNTSPFAIRKIKQVKIKTSSGEFMLDPSFENLRVLIDLIVTYAGLELYEDGAAAAIYRRI